LPDASIVPLEAFHVTDLLLTAPDTVAVNVCVPLVRMEAVVGEIVTELTTGGATVTFAVADLVLSALLVAVMVSVTAVAGAVYSPAAVIVPEAAFQVTDLSVTVPDTFAVNCCVALVRSEAFGGEMEMELTTAVVTVTVTVADFVLSALLVAVTVSVPAVAGAV